MTPPSNQRYPIIASTHRVEQTIERSRFITTVGHADSVADAEACIARTREEFAGATHNCWAYLVGAPGRTDQVGASDDGEPRGTAGQPMLNVLTHSGVGDVWAVVTRYYGGTKLGTGGLVRAYSGGVQRALASAPRAEFVARDELTLVTPYHLHGSIRRLLEELDARVLDERFAADVTVCFDLPTARRDEFAQRLATATSGQVELEQ